MGWRLKNVFFNFLNLIILSCLLKYADGYTYKEIASILDISEENVKKKTTTGKK